MKNIELDWKHITFSRQQCLEYVLSDCIFGTRPSTLCTVHTIPQDTITLADPWSTGVGKVNLGV